jgi:predicted CopG family antitoxin
MKAQRITITIQDDVHKKLRYVQADLLKKSNATVSMSGVFDLVLRKGLK